MLLVNIDTLLLLLPDGRHIIGLKVCVTKAGTSGIDEFVRYRSSILYVHLETVFISTTPVSTTLDFGKVL